MSGDTYHERQLRLVPQFEARESSFDAIDSSEIIDRGEPKLPLDPIPSGCWAIEEVSALGANGVMIGIDKLVWRPGGAAVIHLY